MNPVTQAAWEEIIIYLCSRPQILIYNLGKYVIQLQDTQSNT